MEGLRQPATHFSYQGSLEAQVTGKNCHLLDLHVDTMAT